MFHFLNSVLQVIVYKMNYVKMNNLLLQIFLWVLKDNDLTGMAFIDTQLYIHQMFSIKNFILAADLMKSISLLRYQEESKTLSLVSRVRRKRHE